MTRAEDIERVGKILHASATTRSRLQLLALRALEKYVGWSRRDRPSAATLSRRYLSTLTAYLEKLVVWAPVGGPPAPRRERVRLLSQASTSWMAGRGRPAHGRLPKFEAANQLLAAIGIGAESASALERTWRIRARLEKG